MKTYASSEFRRESRKSSPQDQGGIFISPPVLQLTSIGKEKTDGNLIVDTLLQKLQTEMEAEDTFIGPQPQVHRELNRDKSQQTGNSGRELIKHMLRMKGAGYKYVFIKGLRKKKEEGKHLTEKEEELLRLNPEGQPRKRVRYARMGGQNLRKPRFSKKGDHKSLTTNCSNAVQEALFHFLGGVKGTVDGVSIQAPKFKKKAYMNFQNKTWIRYLEETGLGYEIHDIHHDLKPGDILSSGKHRTLFLGYTGVKGVRRKNKNGNFRIFKAGKGRKASQIRIIEANLTSKGTQGEDAIMHNKQPYIFKPRYRAARLYDFK